jgi:hypothetical protein
MNDMPNIQEQAKVERVEKVVKRKAINSKWVKIRVSALYCSRRVFDIDYGIISS